MNKGAKMSTYMEAVHIKDRLADFTQDKRILVLAVMALVIGSVSAGVAYVLVKLIALITNIAFHFRFSTLDGTPTITGLGYWVILIPVIGGLIIGFMARYGSE